jgi:spore coat polysaccharide biosynthesis protein SpsF
MNDFVIIIQCRLSSNRLPNKILLKLGPNTLLEFLLNNLKKLKKLKLICAIAKEKNNKKLKDILKKNNIKFHEGSVNNVLKRFYITAKKYNCKKNIIRITSDCPLIDTDLLKKGIRLFKKNKADYISNNIEPSFPHGLDFEIFTFKALENAFKNSNKRSEKEHVTEYIKKNKKFKKINIKNQIKLDRYYRWTIDTKLDYKFVKVLYKKFLVKKKIFNWIQILNFLKKNQEIQQINGSNHHFYFN